MAAPAPDTLLLKYTGTIPLSIPSEPHPLEPEAEDPRLRERSLLLPLRQGCPVLVQAGLDCLRRPWSRLLVEASVAGLRGLVKRGCNWFARVRMARARAEGGESPEPVRRIREALMTTSTNGPRPAPAN